MVDFVKTKNGFALNDENERMIAEITYAPYGEDKVIANHTYVDSSLRGQGIAEMLLDRLVVCGKINLHTIAAQKYITPQAA